LDRLLEVCVDSTFSLEAALEGGADRIELCSSLGEGGLTPSYGFMKLAKKISNIPVFALIRPRSGNFVYSKNELEIIFEDIEIAKALGADGIVCGFLNQNLEIDEALTLKAVKAASPLPFTFHRAIDVSVTSIKQSVKLLKEIGVKRILTSGKAKTAHEGLDNLKKLLEEANNEISILAGSGINSQNVTDLLNLGIYEVHASCSSPFAQKYGSAIKMGAQEDSSTHTDINKVRALRRAISFDQKQ